MGLATRLQQRMQKLGMTQRALAKVSGVSQVSIHNIISGKSETSRKLPELAETLGCSPEWLRTGNPETPPLDIPVARIDLLGCEEPAYTHIPYDILHGLGKAKDEITAIVMPDEAMMPRIHAGDTLLVDVTSTETTSGSVYALMYADSIRVLRIHHRFNGYLLSADNPSSKFRDEELTKEQFASIRILGRVIKLLLGDV